MAENTPRTTPMCGLWGCGRPVAVPATVVTVLMPDPPVEKQIVVCEYHATMLEKAA